jgi:hypothetical protein
LSREAIARIGYNPLGAHWRAAFGREVRKIPLDAGFLCPNRDGTISRGGCAFCNPQGSGTGLHGRGLSLAGQWRAWRAKRLAKWGPVALVAYLQAFSNTHGPVAKLQAVLDELAGLPDLEGLCLATRPDCLDEEKIACLAAFPCRELWLELGLQSANEATLARLNRGHGVDCFVDAVNQAATAGLKVCAHVMAGLPGETIEDFVLTVRLVNSLPVAGIKFHNLYVASATPLARELAEGRLTPLGLEQYLDWLMPALARLRPDIEVHRLAADPAPGELIAPAWAGNKRLVHNAIMARLRGSAIRQGLAWEERP